MGSYYSINLIFIFVVNSLFIFPGILLNLIVILSFWRSPQLRRKLCFFMIMVQSCFDLLTVLINHPLLAIFAMFRLAGKFDAISWFYVNLSNMFLGFSLLGLLVMNFERYLATSHAIFHRLSVTKAKLLALLATLITIEVALGACVANGFGISHQVFVLISFIIIVPPMLFMNFKLFMTGRKHRRNKLASPEVKVTVRLKAISSCLLAVACFVILSIPVFVYIGLKLSTESSSKFNNADLVGLWAKTIASVNSTLNCLIFYWKNKILRTEGMKIVRGTRAGRSGQF